MAKRTINMDKDLLKEMQSVFEMGILIGKYKDEDERDIDICYHSKGHPIEFLISLIMYEDKDFANIILQAADLYDPDKIVSWEKRKETIQ